MPRRLPPYLELRPTGFYFRRIIRFEGTSHPAATESKSPSEKKSAKEREDKPTKTARSTFNLSLSTRNEALARRITRRLTSVSDMLLEFRSESGMSLSPNIMLNVLREVRSYELAAYDLARASQDRHTLADARAAIMREKDIQDVLRHALALNDGSLAEGPIKRALAAMGVSVAGVESDPSWQSLTFHSSRILLEVSEERAGREGGVFRTESPVLAEIGRTLGCDPAQATKPVFQSSRLQALPDAAFAAMAAASSTDQLTSVAPVPQVQQVEAAAPVQSVACTSLSVPSPAPATTSAAPISTGGKVEETSLQPAMQTKPLVVKDVSISAQEPAAVNPNNMHRADDPVASLNHESKRPTSGVDLSKLWIDARLLTEATRKALKNPDEILLSQAFALLFEIAGLGYNMTDLTSTQKRNAKKGGQWKKENQASFEVSARIALDYFGDAKIMTIPEHDVTAFIEHVKRIPFTHGKSPKLRGTVSYRFLVREADEREARQAKEAMRKAAEDPSLREDQKEQLILDAHVRRLSTTTFVKHCRRLQAAGRILEHLRLIHRNPFAVCSWTNEEESELRRFDVNPMRRPWDDTILELLAMPIFRGKTKSKDDPDFWGPLLSLCQGYRSEESLQLRLEDIGYEDGIPYIWLHRGLGIRLKEGSSERKIPVHPALLELGFMELVEDQRTSGAIKLFPNLKRGKSKGKHSELASKKFTYQRKKHGVYKPGMDQHALRTTFHDNLSEFNIPDIRRNYITGHSPKDTGARNYYHPKVRVLLRDMRRLKIDVSQIVSPYRKKTPQSECVATPTMAASTLAEQQVHAATLH